ncbi:hypothetical protein [Microbacterium sp. ZW T5_56]|uniref:hypothetical protein n=1 Tax=Microbacterium sp. ZW T5_56 TaxID=3378081 RepID=UPI00385488C8
MRLPVSPALVIIAALGVATLSGCSASPESTSTAAANPPAAVESDSAAEPSATPESSAPVDAESSVAITCADIEPLAASITGNFAFSAVDSVEASDGTTCVWTNDAVTSGSTDIADYAALSVGIDNLAWTAEELSTLPGATDDPRADALGGRVLILGEGTTLGEVGSVQVLFPRGSVTIVATGAMLTASPDTAIPVDAAIDVAAAVAGLRG